MDLNAVKNVYNAINNDKIELIRQPVVRLSNSLDKVDVMYWECLTRIYDSEGEVFNTFSHIGSMERLGMILGFDLYTAQKVIEKLREREDLVLGCNISAASLVDDERWDYIVSLLVIDRNLASRLVLEITETMPPPSLAALASFIERFQSLGCRIALDDFGVGHNTIEVARLCRPDIIKIDASYMPRATSVMSRTEDLLERLIGLASILADIIVVEGVETESDVIVSRKCGATWMQGYYFKESILVEAGLLSD